MKKKRVALLLVFLVFITYLIFLFFIPTKFFSIQSEFTLSKTIGKFLSSVPYLKSASSTLISKYSLLAVFFFILGVLYGKKRTSIFAIFILTSLLIYFLLTKINSFINFNYGLKEFFPLCFTLFTFFYFSQEKNDKLGFILIFFMIFSFFHAIIIKSCILSGIISGFLIALFLGKILIKLNKTLF